MWNFCLVDKTSFSADVTPRPVTYHPDSGVHASRPRMKAGGVGKKKNPNLWMLGEKQIQKQEQNVQFLKKSIGISDDPWGWALVPGPLALGPWSLGPRSLGPPTLRVRPNRADT